MPRPLLRCGICGEEITRGRWRGLLKHVYLYHREYYGTVKDWIEATTPTERDTAPTMERIERNFQRTGQYVFPGGQSGSTKEQHLFKDIVTGKDVRGMNY